MKIFLIIVSAIGLVLTIVPSFFVLAGSMELDLNKNLMFLGTALWFVTVPFWINKPKGK
jgi:hypothetical protein